MIDDDTYFCETCKIKVRSIRRACHEETLTHKAKSEGKTCPVCNMTFYSAVGFHNHCLTKKHNKLRLKDHLKFHCDICNMNFASRQASNYHFQLSKKHKKNSLPIHNSPVSISIECSDDEWL